MKKTLSINLNGRVFNIDEDAYELLENYLNNLKSYFSKKQDSTEIIRSFEARIEALFQERIRLGYNVISIEQIETIIQQMGKPEDFGDKKFEPEETSVIEEKPKKRFYRNIDDKILGGVCSGTAAYFGWDPVSVRIILFISIFLFQFLPVFAYLLLWVFMPAAKTANQKLEMRGEAVTLENIGKMVSETITTINKDNDGCLSTFLKFGLGCLGCIIGVPLIFALCIVLIVLFAVLFGGITGITSTLLTVPLAHFGLDPIIISISSIYPIIGAIASVLVLGIPLFSIIYALFESIMQLKPLNKTIKWICLIIWISALLAVIFSGIKINDELINVIKIKQICYCPV